MGGELPFLCPRFQVDRIEVAIGAAHVRRAIGDGGRGNYLPLGRKFPFDLSYLLDTAGIIDAGMCEVSSKHGGIAGEHRKREKERNDHQMKAFHSVQVRRQYRSRVSTVP